MCMQMVCFLVTLSVEIARNCIRYELSTIHQPDRTSSEEEEEVIFFVSFW